MIVRPTLPKTPDIVSARKMADVVVLLGALICNATPPSREFRN